MKLNACLKKRHLGPARGQRQRKIWLGPSPCPITVMREKEWHERKECQERKERHERKERQGSKECQEREEHQGRKECHERKE